MVAHGGHGAEHVLGEVDAAAAILVERGDGFALGIQAVFHAGEDGGQHQVGVGVGAGQAVFDAQVAAVRFGDADACIAVLETPAGAAGGVDHGAVAAVGVVVGGEDRHAVRQQLQAAGHGMP
ncbi:hypothetical protein D3C86_1704630 [compost metagenome]